MLPRIAHMCGLAAIYQQPKYQYKQRYPLTVGHFCQHPLRCFGLRHENPEIYLRQMGKQRRSVERVRSHSRPKPDFQRPWASGYGIQQCTTRWCSAERRRRVHRLSCL